MALISVQRWVVSSQKEDLSGLNFVDATLDTSLGPDDVLVEMRAGSINYRDLVVAKGQSSHRSKRDVIAGSDGAGIVIQVGSNINRFAAGDYVVTFMTPEVFEDASLPDIDDSTFPTYRHIQASLGQGVNGTMTTHGIFSQSCLVKIGNSISFEQAATLTCSGITAWNGLMGLPGREVKKRDWVLVQGTGGVSVAAIQFALALGATVVATTSSEAKADKLRALGAHHIINYTKSVHWGQAARDLTPHKRGIDIVIDVGGQSTMAESFAAIRTDGLIVSAGLLGTSNNSPDIMAVLAAVCIVRGVVLGSRQMMRDMVDFIEERGVQMVMDDKVFALSEYKQALIRLEEKQHFSKVLVRMT